VREHPYPTAYYSVVFDPKNKQTNMKKFVQRNVKRTVQRTFPHFTVYSRLARIHIVVSKVQHPH